MKPPDRAFFVSAAERLASLALSRGDDDRYEELVLGVDGVTSLYNPDPYGDNDVSLGADVLAFPVPAARDRDRAELEAECQARIEDSFMRYQQELRRRATKAERAGDQTLAAALSRLLYD